MKKGNLLEKISKLSAHIHRLGIENFDSQTATTTEGFQYPVVIGEFWTSSQRQAANLHEVSYRACFKPQLPKLFIDAVTKSEDVVYDPFAGRGTTAIEAGLNGRQVVSNDVNPISTYFARPRLELPRIDEVEDRLQSVPKELSEPLEIDLSMFYDDQTLMEIGALRLYLRAREKDGNSDSVDRWIRMAATNRLTGHSPGFFSVYTMPPNQAVSQASQEKINLKRNQSPTYRDTHELILKKSRQLQRGLSSQQILNLQETAKTALFLESDAGSTPEIKSESIQLTVTSPPFLDVVQYASDNWLRGWFNSIDMELVSNKITMAKTVEEWSHKMRSVFEELWRVTKTEGFLAFEVGDVRKNEITLEEQVVRLGVEAGFTCLGVLLNTQQFTKTSNIWGISNNKSGTNSNKVVVFTKE